MPLLGSVSDEARWRAQASDALGRLMTVGAIFALGLMLLSPALGPLLTTGLPSDATVTAIVSLAILALASYCQITGASLAAALAAARRFNVSAGLYAAGTATSVVLAGVLMLAIGILGAPLGVLGGSTLLLAGHRVYLRRFDFEARPAAHRARERDTWRLAALASASAAIALGLQLQLTIALGTVSGDVGVVTAYTYGYFIAALLTSVTISVVGFVMLPGLLAALEEHGERAVAEYLGFAVPLAAFLFLGLAGAYAVFGLPVVEAVLGDALSARTLDVLWDTSRLFLAMNVGLAILSPLSAALLALQRYRALVVPVTWLLAVHAVATIVLATVAGPVSVAAAHATLGALLVVPVIAMGLGRSWPRQLARLVVRSLPAGVFALVFPLIALLLADPDGLFGAVAASTLGLAIYGAAGVFAWPSVGGRAIKLLLGR